MFRKAASSYPLPDTRRIIKYLGKMDTDIKGTGSEWISMMFSSLLYTIIMRKGMEEDICINEPILEGDGLRS